MKQTFSHDDQEEEKEKKEKPKTGHMSEAETGLDDFIYQNVEGDKINDLGCYMKWHKNNPNCSTPRAPRRGVESQIAAGTTFRCDPDSEYAGLVYIKVDSKKESDLPDEFANKPIGKNIL